MAQISKVEMARELARVREENMAFTIALSTPGAFYKANHGRVYVEHFAPMRADMGVVMVRYDGRHSMPTAMFGVGFDEYARCAREIAALSHDYELADFWTHAAEHVRQNCAEALAVAS